MGLDDVQLKIGGNLMLVQLAEPPKYFTF